MSEGIEKSHGDVGSPPFRGCHCTGCVAALWARVDAYSDLDRQRVADVDSATQVLLRYFMDVGRGYAEGDLKTIVHCARAIQSRWAVTGCPTCRSRRLTMSPYSMADFGFIPADRYVSCETCDIGGGK